MRQPSSVASVARSLASQAGPGHASDVGDALAPALTGMRRSATCLRARDGSDPEVMPFARGACDGGPEPRRGCLPARSFTTHDLNGGSRQDGSFSRAARAGRAFLPLTRSDEGNAAPAASPVGEWLARTRQTKGLTRRELAERSGVSEPQIWRKHRNQTGSESSGHNKEEALKGARRGLAEGRDRADGGRRRDPGRRHVDRLRSRTTRICQVGPESMFSTTSARSRFTSGNTRTSVIASWAFGSQGQVLVSTPDRRDRCVRSDPRSEAPSAGRANHDPVSRSNAVINRQNVARLAAR